MTVAGNLAMIGAGISTQLTVLAAPPIYPGSATVQAIELLLASNAKTYAGNGFSPCRRNDLAAFLTVRQPRTSAQLLARALDRIVHRRIDLILHGTIACPTGCHGVLLLRFPQVPINPQSTPAASTRATQIAQTAKYGSCHVPMKANPVRCGPGRNFRRANDEMPCVFFTVRIHWQKSHPDRSIRTRMRRYPLLGCRQPEPAGNSRVGRLPQLAFLQPHR